MIHPEIVADIAKGYGIELTEIAALEGGLDSDAAMYRAVGMDGRVYVVKLRSFLDPGIALSAWMGIDEVVAPIPTLQGEIARRSGNSFLLLYPFVEGQNGFERPLRAEHWRAVGHATSKIHRLIPPVEITSALRTEDFQTQGEEGYHTLAKRLAESYDLTPTEKSLKYSIEKHASLIEVVLTRTRELGEACRKQNWNLVPCHADLHVGNILAAESGEIHIVDWDAPRMAPIECDLVFFCGGGITGHGEMEERSFFEGYGTTDINWLALTYYRFARAMEDIVSFAREAVDPSNRDPQESLRYFEMLFGPRMIAESAIQSDERLLQVLPTEASSSRARL